MQNKPNFLDALMNVTSFYTEEYENIANWKLGENKPNTNPIQTQSNPISKGIPYCSAEERKYLIDYACSLAASVWDLGNIDNAEFCENGLVKARRIAKNIKKMTKA